MDVGYSVHLAFLTIRPQVGLGEATITSIDYLGPLFDRPEEAFTSSTTHLYVNPQLAVLVNIAFIYVGADAGALVIPSVAQESSADSKTFRLLLKWR